MSIGKTPASDFQKSEFTLKISGKAFGTDKSKITVVVTPKRDIFQPPAVTELSEGGTIFLVKFVASDDYDPETLTVTVDGKTTEPFVISTPAGQSELQKYVKVYRSIIDPQNVKDIFGTRIAKRFIVVQVTVTNRNKQYQLLIHDISMDISTPEGMHREEGSVELHLLRGVAEVGQYADLRNRVLRSIRGAGTVAAGLLGVTTFGSSFAPSIALWNGPLVSAYTDVWPDLTVNQMNRLNDSAYASNTIVPKQQAKVMAVFVPQSILLDKKERKSFWKEPKTISESLLRHKFLLDGNFIENVEDLEPILTSTSIDPAEMKNFQKDKPEVKGSISGKYLLGTDIKLLNTDLTGVTIHLDGTPTDTKLDFVINASSPVPPNKVLKLGVSKKGQDGVKETDLAISYGAATPTLTKIDPASLTQGDQDKVVTLTGSNFLPGSTQVVVAPADGVTVSSVEVKDSKTLEAKMTVTAAASTSNRQVTVVTPGGSSSAVTLTTEKKK